MPALIAMLVSSPGVSADDASGARRVGWASSRLRGRPEPPPPYRIERVMPALELKSPVVVTHVPGSGRILVVEQNARVVTFANAHDAADLHVALDLRARDPKAGSIYGLAFDPGFERNFLVYLCYVLPGNEPDGTRVSRFRCRSGKRLSIDEASEEVLITWLSGGHNGGCLQFGPDGYLYISTGDATAPSPPDGLTAGQDVGNLLSSILRIDVRSVNGPRYRVPSDNPFVGQAGVRPEIWAYGLRNPWKISFDPFSGDLWVGDVGWELWEMVFRVVRGGNYGWSIMEGRQPIRPDQKRGPTPILPPTAEHPHTEARSVTGGRVYRGLRLPELVGEYVYADYETGIFWGLRHDGERVTRHRELARCTVKIVAFGEDAAGEMLFLSYQEGGVYRLAREVEAEAGVAFPRRLGETGLFVDTARQQPAPGVLPYSIHAERWDDGATARRWIALPGDRSLPGGSSGFEFPDGTVFAKTLSLRERRVETRLLHRQGGEWRSYTYEWSSDGSDAHLVPPGGKESEITIVDGRTPGETSTRRWIFASRATCRLCHNFKASAVLGFEARQLAGRTTPLHADRDELERLRDHGLLEEGDRQLGKRRPALVSSRDTSASLQARARSYLHVNCSPCHRGGGGGAATIDLSYEHSLGRTRMVDVAPKLGSFEMTSARVVAPGDAGRSTLVYRMAAQGASRMPPVGSRRVDHDGLRLLWEWVETLRAPEATGESLAVDVDRARALRSESVLRDVAEVETGIRRRALASLLDSPRGSLRLVRLLDDGRLDRSVREDVLAAVATRPEPRVHELFRRFLPREQRRERLGAIVDPATILALDGDEARGEVIFGRGARAGCKRCHRVRMEGGQFGPDLSGIGAQRDRRALLESILEPSRSVEPAFVQHTIVTTRGEVHVGIVASRTAEHVVVTSADGADVRVPVAEILRLTPEATSAMSELLLQDSSPQDVADLIAFLAACK